MNDSKTFSPEMILNNLNSHVPPLKIELADSVTSTNKILKERASVLEKIVPTILVAKKQTEGRGRFGRHFVSDISNGLYMSLLLPIETAVENEPQYTILTAAAMVKTLESLTSKKIGIKWVNDLYHNKRKIAGILAETVFSQKEQKITGIIIGIGLNLSVNQQEIPLELQNKMGGLFTQSDTPPPEYLLISEFINTFFDMLQDSTQTFFSVYREHSFVLGKKVTFYHQQEKITALATAISEYGELIVTLPDKSLLTLSSGEISLDSIEETH